MQSLQTKREKFPNTRSYAGLLRKRNYILCIMHIYHLIHYKLFHISVMHTHFML